MSKDKINSFAALSAAIKAGKRFCVGERITSHHKELGEIDWTIIGVGAGGDDTVTLHMTDVMGDYRRFSTPNKKCPWGHNDWEKSDIRRQLNNDFAYGFLAEDMAFVLPVEKTTFQNNADGGGPACTSDFFFCSPLRKPDLLEALSALKEKFTHTTLEAITK